MQQTGDEWVLIDKAVLEEVAKRHNISEDILQHLGEKNRILDEVLSTFSSRWKSNHDYFKLLSRHVVALAEQGNVIIVELGGAIITRHIEHSFHFRMYGSAEFKIATISRRLEMEPAEAEKLIHTQQRLRDHFTRDFLDRNDHDPALYDMLFNNDRCCPSAVAWSIAECIRRRCHDQHD
jgi:cytidylate kinase